MDTRLRPAQTLLLGSLVFGLFFGAGNLIFPAMLGRQAGTSTLPATAGFLLTAVGLPVLGLMASARTGASSAHEMLAPISRRFGVAFSAALCLTIGPLFAIPRTATISFEVGLRPLVGDTPAWLVAFSAVFFLVTIGVALRPGRLMDFIGRYLTPIFLVLLAALVAAALITPMSRTSTPPVAPYDAASFTSGLLDGYNTMDALAALTFAIVIVDATRRLGVHGTRRTAIEIGKAGLIGGAAMALVYAALAHVGATSIGAVPQAENGGVLLAAVSRHYFGGAGQYLIAAIVLVACLKTAIGLTVACSETFTELFDRDGAPHAHTRNDGAHAAPDDTTDLPAHGTTRSLRMWTLLFAAVSFAIANAGLEAIMSISVPVLMFLYPLVIVVILLGLAWPVVAHRLVVARTILVFTAVAAFFDLLAALPEPLVSSGAVSVLTGAAGRILPGYAIGFGWTVPALVGLAVGIVLHLARRGRGTAAHRTDETLGA